MRPKRIPHTAVHSVGVGLGVDPTALVDIEAVARSLAQLAGDEITAALGGKFGVRYKSNAAPEHLWRDPVSEIDERVEGLLRARLAKTHPDHVVIGEEMDYSGGPHPDFVWAVDPIDGTANFVNGFPLFAASVGVLYRGAAIAGAVWCSTSHLLRPGVYHARFGGPLGFDGERFERRSNPSIKRALAGVPAAVSGLFPWDSRKTGSAAIECALAAAGVFRVAKFERPNLWDVAGGVPLVLAGGGEVRTKTKDGWTTLESFIDQRDIATSAADLRAWRQPLIVGDAAAVAEYCALDVASEE